MRMRSRGLATVVLVVAFVASPWFAGRSARSGEAGPALRAGVARIDITPDKPVRMSGYAGRKERSEGVHDPLSARAVVLESGGRRLVLISADTIGFYDGTAEAFRGALGERFKLQPSEIFLCGTHTHSGPTPTLSADKDPNNLEYTRNLQDKLLDVVGQAIAHLAPVQIGMGRGSSPVGCNRREKTPEGTVKLGRNPGGPTDKEVLVMKLAKADGTPTAAVFDYATHATALGPRNLMISGDVLGLAAQFVEKVLGPDLTAPVFAGASGNIDPWFRVLPSFNTENGWIPEPVLLGTMLGEEVVHVFRGIKITSSSGEIRSEFATIELPAKPTGDPAEQPSTRPLAITAARVGDVAFLGVGCELLTELGLQIKAGSPFPYTFVISHCNGTAGYLPPAHLYPEGGYEINTTRFAPEAGELAVQQAIKMLSGLK